MRGSLKMIKGGKRPFFSPQNPDAARTDLAAMPAKSAILLRWLEPPHVLRPCFLMLFCHAR